MLVELFRAPAVLHADVGDVEGGVFFCAAEAVAGFFGAACDLDADEVAVGKALRAAAGGFTNATDFADYLVTKGVPFRDAHAVVGEAVAYCIMNDKALDDCTMEEFKSFSPLIEEDIYDKISIDTCIHKRQTIGAPGPQQVQAAIDANQLWLDGAKATHEAQAEKLAF